MSDPIRVLRVQSLPDALPEFFHRHGGCVPCRFRRYSCSLLCRLRSFVTGFGKLHHDEFAVSAVLSVELHDSVGGGSGTGEEIKNDTICFITCNIGQQLFNVSSIFGVFKNSFPIKQFIKLLRCSLCITKLNTSHNFRILFKKICPYFGSYSMIFSKYNSSSANLFLHTLNVWIYPSAGRNFAWLPGDRMYHIVTRSAAAWPTDVSVIPIRTIFINFCETCQRFSRIIFRP